MGCRYDEARSGQWAGLRRCSLTLSYNGVSMQYGIYILGTSTRVLCGDKASCYWRSVADMLVG